MIFGFILLVILGLRYDVVVPAIERKLYDIDKAIFERKSQDADIGREVYRIGGLAKLLSIILFVVVGIGAINGYRRISCGLTFVAGILLSLFTVHKIEIINDKQIVFHRIVNTIIINTEDIVSIKKRSSIYIYSYYLKHKHGTISFNSESRDFKRFAHKIRGLISTT